MKYKELLRQCQSCLTLRYPMDCSPPGFPAYGNASDKNTGNVCHVILWGIFPTQGSHPALPHCRWILYCLSRQGSSRKLEWVDYPSPGDPPDPGIEPRSTALQADFLPTEHPGKPNIGAYQL